MKCKTCNKPVLYFGCQWQGAKKGCEKVFWYCFDCGLQAIKYSLHNTIKKCYTKEEVIRGMVLQRNRKIEYLKSPDFGDSIRSLNRKTICLYAYAVSKLMHDTRIPITIKDMNTTLYNWGMKALTIEDLDPQTQISHNYFAYATYYNKLQTFLGKSPIAKGLSDINEVDWFNNDDLSEDTEGQAKWDAEQAEEAARKRYFMSLIVPQEYRERWENDREKLIQELEERKCKTSSASIRKSSSRR